jgi:hypothetical protein
MTQEEKSQAQDVLNGLLRDSYQTGYNQGFADGLEAGKSEKESTTREAKNAQAPTGIKACLDCVHCHNLAGLPEKHICRLASTIKPNPVTGKSCYTDKVHCWKERKDGSCGPEGRNFEMRRERGFFSLLFGLDC